MIITILSDSPFICTGYSDQAKQLAMYLVKQGHQIHYLANAFMGQTIKSAELKDGTKFDFSIYGPKVFGDNYFANQISQHLKETKSEIFLVLLDTFMLHGDPRNPQGWFMGVDTSPAKTIFWYPSDGGGGLPKHCERILMKCDKAVAMSKFAQKQVKDYYNLDTDYIPLATDPKRFYKLPEDQKLQLKAKWGLEDKFVIGSVFRNQPRKNPDKYMKTMKATLDALNMPDAILLLHTDPRDVAAPVDLWAYAQKLGIENRVRFTGMSAMNGFDWDKMNDVYNLFDVFYLPTSGEGFGIPIIEAMSCEVPVIATSYTTTAELIELTKSGYGAKLVGTPELDMFSMSSQAYDLLSNNGTILGGGWEVERGFVDVNDAAKKIGLLYNSKELRLNMGQNGRKSVLGNYQFEEHVGKPFVKLFEQLL